MRSSLIVPAALLLTILSAIPAKPGQNPNAHCKLNWGSSFNSTQTDISTPGNQDTPVQLWASVVGLNQFDGLDLQLIVSQDQSFFNGASLPDAWQLQFNTPTPCPGNDANLTWARGTAFNGVAGIATANTGMIQGTASDYSQFQGLWIFSASAAGVLPGAAKDPTIRYGLWRFDMTIRGTTCAGAQTPICIWPNLRQGYNYPPPPDPKYANGYLKPVAALLDGNDDLDFAHFDPGFDHLTANYSGVAGVHGCPAPTSVQSTTWGRLKRSYR